MTIKILWKTSRGLFKDKEEAHLKKNCVRSWDSYLGRKVREKPIKIKALYDGECYYSLTSLEVV